MRDRFSIHILDELLPDSALRGLLLPGIAVSSGPNPDPQARVLVAGRPNREQIEACPQLETLIIPFAGLPDVTRDLMRDFAHIAVHNLHHNAAASAEMAIALLMAAARSIVVADRLLRADDWTPRYETPPGMLLQGKHALILGYGAIGQRVAAVCRALGMTVSAVRRRATGEADTHGIEQLNELLPRTQVLMICLPATDATHGLIDDAALKRLPRGAILVNVGRAAIVDEGALYHALETRHLLAAGLDVWYRYPDSKESRRSTRPSEYPFAALDNVVMSPHRAGGMGLPDLEAQRMQALANSLNAAAQGQPIPHKVDLEAGY